MTNTNTTHTQIVIGCDCFYCANSDPSLAFTYKAIDCSLTYAWPIGTQFRVIRSDGVEMGRMMKAEILEMRAQTGCTIEFSE